MNFDVSDIKKEEEEKKNHFVFLTQIYLFQPYFYLEKTSIKGKIDVLCGILDLHKNLTQIIIIKYIT